MVTFDVGTQNTMAEEGDVLAVTGVGRKTIVSICSNCGCKPLGLNDAHLISFFDAG